MADTKNLANQIDAAFAAMEEKRRKFQADESKRHQDWVRRLDQLGGIFDGLRDVWKPRLEVLMQKFGDKVTAKPSLAPSSRNVALDFQSEVAKIRMRFQATTDHDIRKIILHYDLEIIPILMQFDSHAELEMPIDAIDREAIGRWIDERILSFVQTYVSLHENQYYLKEQMVQDPVSGTRFPKFSAGATLERDGKKYYFISEESRREFESKGATKAR